MASTASRLERRHVTTGPADVDVSGLKRALERAVAGEVRFDAGTRAMYANDFSIYRAVPIGVVIPTGPDDVIAAVAVCREYQAPVLPRGCGTAPSGQTTNVAVVFDYSKYYNEIVELDPDIRRAVVQPGVICDQLRNAAEEYDLTYGPDPATHEYCTFGGMLGNNSCGTHSLMAGKTSDNVIELDVLLYDGTRMTVGPTTDEGLEEIIAAGGRKGEIYDELRNLRDRVADRVRAEFPDIPRRVSGYNLDQLLPENGFNVARALVGSEGTCANILHATVRLVPSPQHRRTLLLGYPDVFQAADHVPVILERTQPIGLEGFDDQLIKNMIAKGRLAAERTLLPAGRAWLYVEFGRDDADEVEEETRRALELLADGPQIDAKVIVDKLDQVSVWKVRESAVGDSRAPGYMDAEGNWEDAAVHPNKLGAYLRDFQQILDDHGYRCVYYGHFGQGCVHTRMDFDLKTRRRRQDVPVVHGEVRRPRRRLRRVARRRVRRGSRPRRAAAEDVRPRADGGVQRLQADLGSRLEDEPEPPDRRRQARRGPASRPRLPAAGAEDPLRLSPTTAARSRPRSSAASGWPSAATSAA